MAAFSNPVSYTHLAYLLCVHHTSDRVCKEIFTGRALADDGDFWGVLRQRGRRAYLSAFGRAA